MISGSLQMKVQMTSESYMMIDSISAESKSLLDALLMRKFLAKRIVLSEVWALCPVSIMKKQKYSQIKWHIICIRGIERAASNAITVE